MLDKHIKIHCVSMNEQYTGGKQDVLSQSLLQPLWGKVKILNSRTKKRETEKVKESRGRGFSREGSVQGELLHLLLPTPKRTDGPHEAAEAGVHAGASATKVSLKVPKGTAGRCHPRLPTCPSSSIRMGIGQPALLPQTLSLPRLTPQGEQPSTPRPALS